MAMCGHFLTANFHGKQYFLRDIVPLKAINQNSYGQKHNHAKNRNPLTPQTYSGSEPKMLIHC